MSMIEAIRTGCRRSADSTGRAGRPEFWCRILFTCVLGPALGVVPVSASCRHAGTLGYFPSSSGLPAAGRAGT